MNWIAFVLAFQLGWIPSGGFASYDPPLAFVDGSNQFYQMAEAKAILFKTVEIGGSIKVQDWICRGELSFWPNQLDSVFFADILFGPVTVGWRHECIHPVVPYQPYCGIKPSWDGGMDEIYARVELKWGG